MESKEDILKDLQSLPSGYTKEQLKELQSLPLEDKIRITQDRIREWYEHFDGKVCISLSGGKDSTVLLHLVRELFPDVPAVFSDTGLEFPEVRAFARNFQNTDIVRPKMDFRSVIETYGYPIVSKEVATRIHYARKITHKDLERSGIIPRIAKIGGGINDARTGQSCLTGNETANAYLSTYTGRQKLTDHLMYSEKTKNVSDMDQLKEKMRLQKSMFNIKQWLPLAEKAPFKISHYCCEIMKKSPIAIYQRSSKFKPYIGTMATESLLRKQAWLKHGCNAFDSKKAISTPMAFWTEQDVLEYISTRNIEIASVYGDINVDEKGKYYTTGCSRTGCVFCGFGAHLDKRNRFARLKHTHPKLWDYCMRGGQWADNPDYVDGLTEEPDEYGFVPWNPKKIWTPSADGLGMRYVFDVFNEMYPKSPIIYED